MPVVMIRPAMMIPVTVMVISRMADADTDVADADRYTGRVGGRGRAREQTKRHKRRRENLHGSFLHGLWKEKARMCRAFQGVRFLQQAT